MAAASSLSACFKLLAAAFYGFSSFLIVMVNKSVLTSYGWVRRRARPGRSSLALAPVEVLGAGGGRVFLQNDASGSRERGRKGGR